MNIFQNIKYFDKNGLEIPIIKASNIIIRYDSSNNYDEPIIFNGIFNNETDVSGNFIINELQLVNKGSLLFSELPSVLEFNVYVDGKLIDEKCIISNLSKNNFEKFYSIDYASVSVNHIANSEDENIRYGLNNIFNTKISCIIPKEYDLIFPSIAFSGKISIDRISTGLVENNSLFLAVENANVFDTPIDDDYNLVFITDEDEKEIRFFTVDPLYEEINWTNKIIVDLSKQEISNDENEDFVINNSLPQINIGFLAQKEGIYEQKIYVLIKNRISGKEYKIGEFDVIAEAVGEDERYRALFANFGIPDPVTYPHLFKGAHPDEDKTDWMMINEKSKELFLTYNDIFPYVGTYKALINAVDFLGYDDIYFREWFKKLDTNENVSYRIDVNDIFNDIDNRSHMGIDERILRKKLNHLTMVYHINKETGETDMYNIPIVENVYQYSIDEILVKLIALKEWLQKNIIALNCRIIDITGEGVVYERQDYNIYGQYMQNFEYEDILNIDATVANKVVELIDGSAYIDVSVFGNSDMKNVSLEDFENMSFDDFIYAENNNDIYGPTLEYPIIHNAEIRAYVDTSNAIIGYYGENDPDNFTTKGLWINDGEIQFPTKDVENILYEIEIVDDNGNIQNTGTEFQISNRGFKEVVFEKCPIIRLQSAVLRVDNADWMQNERFIIEPTNYKDYSYSIINLLAGTSEYSNDNIILYPIDDKASFRYTLDNSYNVPLFKIKGYKIILYNDKMNNENRIYLDEFIGNDNEYILEIRDGKIINRHSENSNKITCINFNYDNNSKEQEVNATIQYTESFTYEYGENEDGNINFNNLQGVVANIKVNNIGHYRLMVHAYNNNGNSYAYEIPGGCDIIMDDASIYAYTHMKETENNELFRETITYGVDASNDINLLKYLDSSDYNNQYPTFRETYRNSYLSYNYKDGNCFIQYPNISYAIDTPKPNDYIHLMNICDQFVLTDLNNTNAEGITYPYKVTSVRNAPHNYFLANKFEEHISKDSREAFLNAIDNSGQKIPEDLAVDMYGGYYVRGLNDEDRRQMLSDPDMYQDGIVLGSDTKIRIPITVDSSGEIKWDDTSDEIITTTDYKDLCYCNIVFYNRIYNKAIAEFKAIIHRRDSNNNYVIKFDYPDNSNELSKIRLEFEQYSSRMQNDNNIDMFIMPIGEHNISAVGFTDDSEQLTSFTIENYNSVYNNTSIFRKGDVIKVIYEVQKRKEVVVFITAGYKNVSYFEQDENNLYKFYKDGDKTLGEYVLYDEKSKTYSIIKFDIDDNNNEIVKNSRPINGTIHTRYVNAGNNSIYKGYTSFRVHSFDPKSKILILDGKYNYQQYLSEFLLGYTEDGDIDADIISGNKGYYIMRYKDTDGSFKNLKLRNVENKTGKYSADELFTNIKVAHTHQAFVNYKMKVNDSQEYINGNTKIFTDKNRLYNYLDGTFSFISKPFDIDTAFKFWMNGYEFRNNEGYIDVIPQYIKDYQDKPNKNGIYRYSEPFTMRISNKYLNNALYNAKNDRNIILVASSSKVNNYHIYWKLFKQNLSNKTRELLFEVTNDKLYLNISEKGLYDIEAYIYDNYGNLVKTEYEAFINAI